MVRAKLTLQHYVLQLRGSKCKDGGWWVFFSEISFNTRNRATIENWLQCGQNGFEVGAGLDILQFEVEILNPLNPDLKRTVCIISTDPLCKDGNVRFTTVPFKAWSDQVWIRYSWIFEYLYCLLSFWWTKVSRYRCEIGHWYILALRVALNYTDRSFNRLERPEHASLTFFSGWI